MLAGLSLKALLALSIGVVATFNYMFLAWWTSGFSQTTALDLGYDYPMYDVMMIVGDSITQSGYSPSRVGYVGMLANRFQRQMDVVARGFSGYNSTKVRSIIKSILPRTQTPRSFSPSGVRGWLGVSRPHDVWLNNNTKTIWPSIHVNKPHRTKKMQLCVFLVGTNDASLKTWYQHVSLEKYTENMRYFVSLLRDPNSEHYSPDTRILIVTPPPLGEQLYHAKGLEWVGYPVRFNNLTKKYAEAAKQVAIEANIPFVDLYQAIEELAQRALTDNSTEGGPSNATLKYDGYNKYLVDGIHLNKYGNKVLFWLIVNTMKKYWPELVDDWEQR